jgi:hypothetical protein
MTSTSTDRWPPSSARPSSARNIRKRRATSSRCSPSRPASWCARSARCVFGRIGDLVGRKYTFLVTIVIMGLSTFLVGVLPGSATWGIAGADHPDWPAHAAGSGARR